MTVEQLNKLESERTSFDERVDIKEVKIDQNAPAAERAEQYLSQIHNPYHFRCGDLAINVEFSEGGKPLRDCIKSYLIRQKEKE
ncbi:MAG: hypothetical protein LBM93_07550 [Oscillospiraceae bacterium]|nr:hypothetical protein [Oscillospiraceae bacterium]